MRPSSLAFLCLALFLVVWPLTVQKPGLPYSMKADEPAYLLMARSLWEDRDLRCEPKDLVRAHRDYFYKIENVILMTTDGWQTAYFSKPWLASLLAAPLVRAFGANGFAAFNMACFLAAVWLGWVWLGARHSRGFALIFALAFFFLSTSYAYVFWLQPETLTLLLVTAGLFLTFHELEDPTRRLARLRWWLVGLCAGPVISIKPPFAVMLLPAVVACLPRRHWRHLAALGAATFLSTAALAAGQQVLTGTWSPYLGAMRRSFLVTNPTVLPIDGARQNYLQELAEARAEELKALSATDSIADHGKREVSGRDWGWVFSLPRIPPERILFDVKTFFLGRHTGVLVYWPFLGLALLGFATGGGWRDPRRWAILLGYAGVALFLLGWNFENYHGGRGFVGNRYFAPIYPMALFLFGTVRPRGLLAVGAALSGLFLGQILFAPFGMPVEEPTLQTHTRGIPFRWLPYEINLDTMVPGNRGTTQGDIYFQGRRDRLTFHEDWLSIQGRGPAELILKREEPVDRGVFLLRSWVPGNVVKLRAEAGEAVVTFPDLPPPVEGLSAQVELEFGPPTLRMRLYTVYRPYCYWRLLVDPRHAARPSWSGDRDRALVGVRMLYLGGRARLEADVYAIDWLDVQAPATVAAGAVFEVRAGLANASSQVWDQEFPAQVRLGYRWRDAEGGEVPATPHRTSFDRPLRPGEVLSLPLKVEAPALPGDYRLVLEPVFEHVHWFSDVDPATTRSLEVCVDAPAL